MAQPQKITYAFSDIVSPAFYEKMLAKGIDLHKAFLEGQTEVREKRVAAFEQTEPLISNRMLDLNTIAGIEELYRGFSISDCKDSRCALGLQKFANDGFLHVKDGSAKFGVYLAGNFGVGKTTTACAVLRERMRISRKNGLKVRASIMVREIQEAIQKNDYISTLRKYAEMPCLLIDELAPLHVAGTTDSVREIMYEIFEFRKNKQGSLFTIITTNADNQRLEDIYGAAVMDRIKELCAVIHLQGENLRNTNSRVNTLA